MTPTLRRFRASHPVCTHDRRLRRTWLPLGLALAAGLLAPAAFAQSNYATPLYFFTLAGSPGVAAEVDGTADKRSGESPPPAW
ncbi:hypothetical protein [Horticoccus sp. 23ND18S-11]|uniref:hypothetical protein n=1 Tax=Horticoccus sp. 23ND18S-11 TaxID=3391832 RepID=UPI0039C927C1